MKWMFVDTAGWVASVDSADPHHVAVSLARDRWMESGGGLLTTDYIVDETLTLLRMRIGLGVAEAWWNRIESSDRVRIELADPMRLERARALFFRYRDKDFSFTDCVSFIVMRELRIPSALTLDAHFRQAGFDMIPPAAK